MQYAELDLQLDVIYCLLCKFVIPNSLPSLSIDYCYHRTLQLIITIYLVRRFLNLIPFNQSLSDISKLCKARNS